MSREQIEELLDVANRPRAEVVITQQDDSIDSPSDLGTQDETANPLQENTNESATGS